MHFEVAVAFDPADEGTPRHRRPPGKGTRGVPDIALVDDDDQYREVLSADLIDRGFSVSCFADGPSFLEALESGIEAQIALLDWALPKMTGFELLGVMRERGIALPVVFLTGYSLTERELQALDHGAVDFVDKARGTDVLAHRLRLIIEGQRRRAGTDAAQAQVERHGELALHRGTARAVWRGHDISLTVTEYKIVTLLVSHKGELQTYRAIYDAAHFAGFVAGSGEHGYATNVRSLVKRIRRKFVAVDPGFSAIENVQRAGYRWREVGPTE
jgi:two-component system, OmpR family, response regulator ChvI